MQFQFSQYQYQTDAADAVCDVFDGQPLQDGVSYIRDVGIRKPVFPDPEPIQDTLFEDNRPKQATFNSYDEDDDTGYRNADLLLTYERLLANVKNVQRRQNLEESPKLYADPAGAVELAMEEADRQNWELLYYDNTDPEEGRPEYILDNNPSSYWHSNYRDGQQKPYPFTFVIDMKDELMVGKLGAMSRENNYYTKGISYYISDDDEFTAGNPDGNQWTYIGEIELLKQNGMQWSEVITSTLEKQVKGRYLKIICTSGHGASHLGAIAEITVQKVTAIDGEDL